MLVLGRILCKHTEKVVHTVVTTLSTYLALTGVKSLSFYQDLLAVASYLASGDMPKLHKPADID